MAKNKETYSITLETDEMDFISQTKEKYDIADEDKVLRIIIDYVMTSPELHSTVFTETRCLRCE